jgi:type VI secretion system secreted protein Hcp
MMAYEAYLAIKGERQGQIRGQSGKWIPLVSFNLEVTSPRDASTGQASGKRQHKPITVGVSWGNWSPQIFSALTANEALTLVKLDIRGSKSDDWLRLKNAAITNLQMSSKGGSAVQEITFEYETIEMGKGKQTTAKDSWSELVKVAFVYQKITFTYNLSKTAAADDWEA